VAHVFRLTYTSSSKIWGRKGWEKLRFKRRNRGRASGRRLRKHKRF
jgi:hypothetical protein